MGLLNGGIECIAAADCEVRRPMLAHGLLIFANSKTTILQV